MNSAYSTRVYKLWALLIALPLLAAADPAAAANPEPAGWFAGDMHVHRSCGGSPQAVSALYNKMSTNNLSVISLLADMGNGEVQNPVTDLPLVNGQDVTSPPTPGRIVHWDTEWHWDATYFEYDHQALGGHIVALGLTDAEQVWEEYTGAVFDWAHQRNGIAGFAHMQYLDGGIPQTLTCCTPIEYPVEVALKAADFISEDVDGNDYAIEAYYRLLNTGFRPGFAAGTDYPCNSGKALGSLLTYAQVSGGQLTYRNWIEGIRAGKTVVSRNGHKEFLDLKVSGAGPGNEIKLTGAGSVPVTVTWTASQKFTGTIELVRNGVVIASKQATVPAGGSVSLPLQTVSFDKSGWLAARRMGASGHTVHTAAVFVTVDNKPVRTSAQDALFYLQWIDNLLAKTSAGGAWNSYFPTSLSAAQARYTAARVIYQKIADEAGGGTTPMPGEQWLFTSQSPSLYENDARYELGTTFYVDFPGNITKVRLFTNSAESGYHSVNIWRADGTLIYALPDPGWYIAPATAGWKTLTLPAPVHILANTSYIVAISNGSSDWSYAEQPHGLDSPITNGNLHAVAGGGVWTDALGTMPTSVWQNTNYFRDVVFVNDTASAIARASAK